MLSDAFASLLTSGSTALQELLHCHCLLSVGQWQIAVVSGSQWYVHISHFVGFLVPVEFTQIFQGYLLKRAIIRLPQFRRSTRVYMDRWNTWNHEKLAMWQMPTKMEARLEPCAYIADSRFVPSQWETALVYNGDSHKLVASLKSALSIYHETEWVGCECNKMPIFLKPSNL